MRKKGRGMNGSVVGWWGMDDEFTIYILRVFVPFILSWGGGWGGRPDGAARRLSCCLVGY